MRRRPAARSSSPDGRLPGLRSVLAVCAHPDDESFGLGAVISALVEAGTRVSVLSFTHGEASTLRGVGGDLGELRAAELTAAGRVLGVTACELLAYPDGGLERQPLDELAARVRQAAGFVGADGLLVFDPNGVTGHPDHRQATAAAVSAAGRLGLPVLAWVIAQEVAEQLNAELGTTFAGRSAAEVDIVLRVDRARQHAAIAEHRSQSTANPVLVRRLELQGAEERLRWLSRPATGAAAQASAASSARARASSPRSSGEGSG